MSLSTTARAWRRAAFALTAFVVLTAALFIFGGEQSVEATALVSTPAAAGGGTTFPANAGTLGAIPDRGTAGCGPPAGPNRDVTFTVSGLSGSPTAVSINANLTHTWVGDVGATLIAPNGTSHVIFERTGAITATSCGDSSDLGGLYNFTDAAAGVNWWQAAATAGGTDIIPVGDYRTTQAGPQATANNSPVTSLNTAFAGVPDPNGTWTLRLNDVGGGDTGSISAANLTITTGGGPGPSGNGPVDYDGDGKTDYAVVRNVGGGSEGQLRWFIDRSSGGPTIGYDWGLASDFVIAGDFDGDGKDDIAVWRPGLAGIASFYILNSATNTVRTEAFGQTGDNPIVVGDYNGNGMTDIAVYREGLTPSDPSFFYYRTVPEGPVNFVQWGKGGDFVAPGDYDGDGKQDFAVQRAEGGLGIFWILRSSDFGSSATHFGLATDMIAPGDYDGDGKTDLAVVRATGGSLEWYYRSSSNPATVVGVNWGLSANFIVPGDYTGNGRSDFAIWRDGVFWILDSETFAVSVYTFGTAGDYPVANFIVQ